MSEDNKHSWRNFILGEVAPSVGISVFCPGPVGIGLNVIYQIGAKLYKDYKINQETDSPCIKVDSEGNPGEYGFNSDVGAGDNHSDYKFKNADDVHNTVSTSEGNVGDVDDKEPDGDEFLNVPLDETVLNGNGVVEEDAPRSEEAEGKDYSEGRTMDPESQRQLDEKKKVMDDFLARHGVVDEYKDIPPDNSQLGDMKTNEGTSLGNEVSAVENNNGKEIK